MSVTVATGLEQSDAGYHAAPTLLPLESNIQRSSVVLAADNVFKESLSSDI